MGCPGGRGPAGGEAFERAELLGPRGWQREVPLSPAAEVQGSLEVDWRGLPATDEGERYLLLRAHQTYAGEVQPTVVTSAIWIDPPVS